MIAPQPPWTRHPAVLALRWVAVIPAFFLTLNLAPIWVLLLIRPVHPDLVAQLLENDSMPPAWFRGVIFLVLRALAVAYCSAIVVVALTPSRKRLVIHLMIVPTCLFTIAIIASCGIAAWQQRVELGVLIRAILEFGILGLALVVIARTTPADDAVAVSSLVGGAPTAS